MLSHVPPSQRRGMGWLPYETGRNSDQKTWIKLLKETTMAVATLSRRTKDGARKRLRTTSLLQWKLQITVSFIRLSPLQPNKSYSKRRCHCFTVILFFSVLFYYFFTHISQRSMVNTLNDARRNPLLKETMSSPPVSYGNPPPPPPPPQIFSFQVLRWFPL